MDAETNAIGFGVDRDSAMRHVRAGCMRRWRKKDGGYLTGSRFDWNGVRGSKDRVRTHSISKYSHVAGGWRGYH